MPIVRLNDTEGRAWYINWSNACDAPKSAAMTRDEMRDYLLREAVREPFEPGPEALAEYTWELEYQRARIDRALHRCDLRGVSICDYQVASGEEFVAFNRAGPKEGCVKPKTILKQCISVRKHWRLPEL